MTPHQRRTLELETLRGLIADCESQIGSGGAIQTAAVAEAFEHHTSLLPADSQLRPPLEGVASRLRRSSSQVIAEANLRKVVASLRPKADKLALWVERRDARLREKR